MSKNCPTCEREFKGFSDYPRIEVVSLDRKDISEDEIFVVDDNLRYSGPEGVRVDEGLPGIPWKSVWEQKAQEHWETHPIPEKVLEYFRENFGESVFNNGTDIWTKFGGDSERSGYSHQSIVTGSVVGQVRAVLTSLDSLVGGESVKFGELFEGIERVEEKDMFSLGLLPSDNPGYVLLFSGPEDKPPFGDEFGGEKEEVIDVAVVSDVTFAHKQLIQDPLAAMMNAPKNGYELGVGSIKYEGVLE